MLATALGAVLERHIEGAPPASLAFWSLRGLEVLEPALRPELRGDVLVLGAGSERPLAVRVLPAVAPTAAPETAAPALAHALVAMFDAAWRTSPALRRVGPERMLRSAFDELFDHLDPHSRYLTPEEALAARIRRVGQAGLGLRLGVAGGRGGARGVVVAALSPDGPAAAAGLRVGDRVVAVDGVPVSGRDLGFAATLLEGPAETEVEIRIERAGRRRAVLLRRIAAPASPVRAETRDGVLWLRIEAFADTTDERLADALFAGSGAARGVVLDLRGNRGGLLSQAVAVASAFLPGGTVALTAGRHPDAARLWQANGPDLAEGLPVVVLVDGRSASAAEIVAAALGDRGRAVVVGSVTTGKGLIQAVVPLPNGGELLVTWSQVLGPGGRPIQGIGVLPTVCTSLGTDALAENLARLRRDEPPVAMAPARPRALRTPPPTPLSSAEIAALRASCPPAEGRDADVAAARALLDSPNAYAAALAR
ncbi:S41 family peptidase [Craurococcus roseus]|uniref:S41 family peptidase n=1 Tax=Craurococcus roseus TaxID=77585 RepID=A0ABP3Q6G7_9PROT